MTAKLLNIIGVVLILSVAPIPGFGADYCFQEASMQYQIPMELLKAISYHESTHNPVAHNNRNKNGSYDFGHMQINSSWYPVLGPERWDALVDPCQNTMVGAWILSQCIQRHGYSWDAIGCYNAGSSPKRESIRKTYAWKIYRALEKIRSAEPAKVSRNSTQTVSAN